MTYQVRRNQQIINEVQTIVDAKRAVASDISHSKWCARVGWLDANQIHHLYTQTRWSIHQQGRVVASYTATG